MKKLSIFLTLTLALSSHFCVANPYKIKEYDDKGKIRITFKHTPNGETEQKYELVSISPNDFDDLTVIRRSKEVVDHYADHKCPTEEGVKIAFEKTFFSRVAQENSLFPFVLKRVTKKAGEVPQKSYKILGFFNLGNGFTTSDRMFGYYMDHEFHRKGIGSKTINVLTHFTMQFHEQASGSLTVKSHKKEEQNIPIKKTKFSGVVCATCDADNSHSYNPLIRAGLNELSTKEIADRGFSEHVKAKIQGTEEGGDVMVDTIKRYLELNWENFKIKEEKGLYK